MDTVFNKRDYKLWNMLLISIGSFMAAAGMMHLWMCPRTTNELPSKPEPTLSIPCTETGKLTDIQTKMVPRWYGNYMFSTDGPYGAKDISTVRSVQEKQDELVETFTYSCERRTPITRKQ